MASKAKHTAEQLKNIFFEKAVPSLIPFQLDDIDVTFYARERVVGDVVIKKDDSDDPRGFAFSLILNHLCDSGGTPVFTEEDIDTLRQKKTSMFTELFNKLAELLFPDVGIVKEGESQEGKEAGKES